MSTQMSFVAGVPEVEYLDDFKRMCRYYERNHPEYLKAVRQAGVDLAQANGRVGIDDVCVELIRRHIPLPKDIGLDARLFGAALYREKRLKYIGPRLTKRLERIKKSGVSQSFIGEYCINEEAVA